MSVRILLTHYFAYRDLSKDFILTVIPETILGQALQDDLEAKEIEIPSPEVTPKALAVIVLLSEGKTPLKSEPECYPAGRYLNYPLLAAFGDPLYDGLNKVDINCENSRMILRLQVVVEPILPYLIWRQLDFSFVEGKVLCRWISTASSTGSKLLLSQPTLNHLADLRNWWYLVIKDYDETVIGRLLEDPRLQTQRAGILTSTFIDKYSELSVKLALLPETKVGELADWQYQSLITRLVDEGDYESLELLLQKPPAKPTAQHVYNAAHYGYVKTLATLLTRKDINLTAPGINPDEIMIIAALGGFIDCVRVLLADGRFSMRYLKGNAILQRYPELQTLYDMTM